MARLYRVENIDRNVVLADRVRMADTFLSRLVGLLRTPERDFQPGAGLWIEPSQGVHTWFMRYPIDLAYLDKELRVMALTGSMGPWRIGPVKFKCLVVLELPGGTLERTQIEVGDRLAITRLD